MNIKQNNYERILRLREVSERVGISRSTIYALMKQDKFPQATPLGLRAVGWVESEIHDWVLQQLEKRESARQQPSLNLSRK